ncbi:MAG TPA: hypothetical protein VEY67_04025 [Candidatus Dormibacteraeota bacterium]|nr:hypothetical protein [Candidatus Dormibacteraeota bacterium]
MRRMTVAPQGPVSPAARASDRSFGLTAVVVVAYALAMAYLESAVVVYLQGALGAQVGAIFPLRPASEAGSLIAIEAGREAATLVMIVAIGLLAGRSALERLAWAAVVFGTWDIAYYGWLYVFSGWPPSLATTDLLFLLPVPWAGPVWSPVLVSVALVVVGLLAARSLRAGRRLVVASRQWLLGLAGGLLVVLSYTLDAGRLIDGGLPGDYPWPVFAAGMLVALAGAVDALMGTSGRRTGSGAVAASEGA